VVGFAILQILQGFARIQIRSAQHRQGKVKVNMIFTDNLGFFLQKTAPLTGFIHV